jgi:hypothetical protein
MGKPRTAKSNNSSKDDAHRILGLPLWGGISAIAGILAVVVAIIAIFFTQGDSTQIKNQENHNGGCPIQGDNNFVNCPQNVPPKSLGNIKFTWAQGAAGFLFKGAPKDLPTPPSYPAEEVRGHCDEWEHWRHTESRVYEVMNQAELAMVGNNSAAVGVRKVQTQVFKKIPLTKPYAFVTCSYGAGLDAGFYIENTLKDNTTTLQEASSETRHPMPPATAHLGKRGYVNGLILIKSSTDYLYEGKVTITAEVNGTEREYQYGTPKEPLRWLGGGLDRFGAANSAAKTYDWDTNLKRWVEGFSPDTSQPVSSSPSPSNEAKRCVSAKKVTDPTGQTVSTWWCPAHRSGNVYASPNSTSRTGYLRKGTNWFVCQVRGRPNPAVGAATNNIWLYTQSDVKISGTGWGWFPATFITNGSNGQPIPGVPLCSH